MKSWKFTWMLVVACLAMVGCATQDDDLCVADADCGLGQRCEGATGQCVTKVVDRSLTCVSASDCLSSELCHPTAKVCVQTCSASAECPDTATTCAAVSSTNAHKVCQCSTDALCNTGRSTPDLVCSKLDKVCSPKCTADAGCGSGRTCDTATGQCKELHTLSTRCQSDTDCLSPEICHPSAKVCVRTCSSSVDCPPMAKTCDALSASDSRKVCKCSTDLLCNTDGSTAQRVCSNLENVCTPKCTADGECGTGRTCDTATGQCKASGPRTCTPACTAAQVCDTNSGTCVNNGAACTGEGQSTCVYGAQFCSSNQCTALPAPSCDNYTNFSSKSSLGTTGRILYGARVVSATIDSAYCGTANPKRVKVAVSAYSSVPFPITKDELNDFFLVEPDGTVVNGPSQVSASAGNYTVSGANRELAEIVVSLCVSPASTTYATGFYFTGGNFRCFQANYP